VKQFGFYPKLQLKKCKLCAFNFVDDVPLPYRLATNGDRMKPWTFRSTSFSNS